MIKIDGFEIDVAVSETHQYDCVVTSDPVESGADITDHVRLKPEVVTLVGIVTDTPIGDIANRREPGETPSSFALDFLRELRELREPVQIETSIRVYDDMVLERLSIPSSKDTGSSLQFTASFRQVKLVTNDRKIVEVELPRHKKKVNKGTTTVPIKEVPPAADTLGKAQQSQSQLSKLADWVAGV